MVYKSCSYFDIFMLLLVFCSFLATKLLPKDNNIPKSREDAKKIISKLGLDYNSIHTCGNDCIFLEVSMKSLPFFLFVDIML